MKKLQILLLFIAAGMAPSFVKAQTLDDVLKEYFSAIGQDKLVKTNSLVTTGKFNQMGMEIPFTQYAMRPSSIRVEGTFQGLSFVQTYNGTEGWSLNPFAGSTTPEPLNADEMKSMKVQADMDGVLWNWKDKGHVVTLEGTEDVEGTSCYKIKVTTSDGDVYNYYIDSDSYMLIRVNSKITMMGNQVESDTYFSNYMQVDGIAFPGKIENRYNGAQGEVIIVDKVELNKDLEASLFNKPGSN